MRCKNHNEVESVETCTVCGNQFCQDCLVALEGEQYCKSCLADGVKRQAFEVTEPKKERKSRFWAFLLSLVPGVGYLYLGLMNRGLQTMVLFFGSVFLSSFIGFEEIMSLVAPVVIFYSVFDTQQLAKKINAGIRVEDNQLFDIKSIPYSHNWLGYALIVIGFLALMHNMPHYFPYWVTLKRMIPPLLIIALGAAILYRNTRKEDA